ncbi:MAG TPA: hypothetical protein VFQ85_13255 [Mycobacteriales bacterium]|jgi:hypothetical protein|nr:hypothetical protein [Mycobacteriales bacterium]
MTVLLATAAPAPAFDAPYCTGGDIDAASLAGVITPACDLTGRTVRGRGVAVTFPRAGHWVEISALRPDSSTSLFVAHGGDRIAVRTADSRAVAGLPPAVCDELPRQVCQGPLEPPPACRQFDHATHSWTASRSLHFEYNPSNYATGQTLAPDAMLGVYNMGGGVNDCGYPIGTFGLEATWSFSTATDGMKYANDDVSCDREDDRNVVDWGPTGGALAVTCSQGALVVLGFLIRRPSDQDIRIDNTVRWGDVRSDAECRTQTPDMYDLQSTTTHEFGHVYGLADLSTGTLQTMYESGGPCESFTRTLGAGDWLGMSSKYAPCVECFIQDRQ